MSLSSSELSELMELWEELNLTGLAQDNLTHVEAVLCPGAVRPAALLQALSVLYGLIFLGGLAGNALVLWVNLRRDGRRDEARPYVVNLAAADLCVVATLPVWVSSLRQGGRWPFGAAACRLTHLVFSANLFGSVFFLTCLSVDRCLAARRPAGAPCRRRAARRRVCVLVWLLALAAAAPDAYFLQAVRSPQHGGGAVCRPVYPAHGPREWALAVQLSFVVLGFAVPLPVIAVSYLLLAAAVPPGGGGGRRLVLGYVAVFVACWLPLHGALLLDALALLGALSFSCRLEGFLDAALPLAQGVALLHCCLNPLLYSFLRRSYRRRLAGAVLFRYSAETGLARLVDASDAECSAATADRGVPV